VSSSPEQRQTTFLNAIERKRALFVQGFNGDDLVGFLEEKLDIKTQGWQLNRREGPSGPTYCDSEESARAVLTRKGRLKGTPIWVNAFRGKTTKMKYKITTNGPKTKAIFVERETGLFGMEREILHHQYKKLKNKSRAQENRKHRALADSLEDDKVKNPRNYWKKLKKLTGLEKKKNVCLIRCALATLLSQV